MSIRLAVIALAVAALPSYAQRFRIESTPNLPDGQVGTLYGVLLSARGGEPPYRWRVVDGTLPPGLAVVPTPGLIGGIPTTAGEYRFTLRASDSDDESDTRGFRLLITGAPVVQTTSLPSGRAGTPYSATLTASGGQTPYTWSVAGGSLPGGVTLSPSGALSGVPSTPGTFDFTARVTDANSQGATQALRIVIAAPALSVTTASLPSGVAGQPYSQALAASGGAPPYSWSISAGTLPGGMALSPGGELQGTPGSGGVFDFTVQARDTAAQVATRPLRLTIGSAPAVTTTTLPGAVVGQAYSQTVSASGGTPPYSWNLAGGSLPAGLNFSPTGTISGTPSAGGDFDFSVRVTDAANLSTTRALRISVVSAVSITTTAASAGTVGQAYAQTLTAAGGTAPYTWTLAGGALPAGVTLSPAGAIAGTPTSAGDFDFTVRVADAAGQSATRSLRISVVGSLGISTTALPSGVVGQPYSQTISAAGGTAPYTWGLASGALPAGLNLSPAGAVSGTPSAAGNFEFAVRVTDGASRTATQSLRISVAEGVSVTTTALPAGAPGQPYSQTLAAAGGTPPYTWTATAGALPPGVTLNPNGTLSGTPTTAGDFDFTVRVADAAGQSATRGLRISVASSLSITTTAVASGAVGQAYSQTLAAAGGTPPYTWTATAGALPPGVTLNPNGTFSGTPTAGGDFDFTVRVADAAGQSATRGLRISVASSLSITTTAVASGAVGQAYSQTLAATGGTPPYTWTATAGALPAGITLNPNGTLSGTPTAGGDFDFTIRVADAAGQSATRGLRISVASSLSITTTAVASGAVGQAYSQTLAATGGTPPYTWTATAGALPAGITLNPNGTLSGTPTAGGDFDFTARVADAAGQSATRGLRISVAASLSITTTAVSAGTVGQAYNQTLAATGGTRPYTWSGTSLPPGLSLNPNGSITGTPSTAGNFDVTARVTDAANQTATRPLRITIAGALAITTTTLAGATAGQPYSQSVAAAGGTPPYVWAVTSGTLPPGVALSPSGALAGIPTASGNFDFTVRATDAANRVVTRPLRITVTPAVAAPTIATAALPTAVAGGEYAQTLSATGGRAPYTWAVAGGTLPPGVTLQPAGVIAGIPANAGVFPFTVRLADADARTAERALSINVTPALAIATCPTPTALTGSPYAAGITAAGGTPPYIWSIPSGQIPPGLSIAPSTGIVTGTPSLAGTFQFRVEASDAASGTASRQCVITVGSQLQILTETLPDATTRATYSQTLRAIGGTSPFRWSVGAGSLPPGLTLDEIVGTVVGQPTQAGQYSFAVQLADGAGARVQRSYNIAVAPGLTIPACPSRLAMVADTYSATLTAAGGQAPFSWTVARGALPSGVTLDATGALAGMPASAGLFEFGLRATDAAGGSAERDCAIEVTPELAITTSTVPGTEVGARYSAALEAIGGIAPRNWTISDGTLPAGLSLNSETGQISGSPSAGGTFRFTARVSDATGTRRERPLQIVVGSGFVITSCPTPAAVLGESYSSAYSLSGGDAPLAWVLVTGELPAGLALDAQNGTVVGTANTAGVAEFVARVTDGTGRTATRSCSINVAPAALRISAPETLPAATLGAEYSAALEASGGRGPFAWTMADGALAPGLTLGPNGVVTGTPTETGAFRFTVRVADADRSTATRSFELRVTPGPAPNVSFGDLPEIIAPAQQPRVRVAIDAAYPAALRGRVTMRFTPDPGLNVDDPAIRFVTGSRVVDFEIPAGSTEATFPVPQLALQTGSVAGVIRLAVTLSSGELDVTPEPVPERVIRIDRTAPVISSVRVVPAAGGFQLVITGFSTTREVTAANFQFTTAPGSRLDTQQVSVPTEEAARQWFSDSRSSAFGGQFTFTQPFTMENVTLSEVSVTLTNAQGTSQPVRARF